MYRSNARRVWTWATPLSIAAALLVAPVTRASAQSANNSDLTVTVTNSSGNPSGADFVAGSWIVASLSYSVRCGANRSPCTLKIATNGALTKPSGSITQLEYSFDGGAFTAVPSTPTQLGGTIATTKTGTIVVRYQLGWAGSPFTPASATAYSQPIQLLLTQN